MSWYSVSLPLIENRFFKVTACSSSGKDDNVALDKVVIGSVAKSEFSLSGGRRYAWSSHSSTGTACCSGLPRAIPMVACLSLRLTSRLSWSRRQMICSEVGITYPVLLSHVADQRICACRREPRLQCEFKYLVRVLILGSQVQELQTNPLCRSCNFAHAFLASKIPQSIYFLDQCVLVVRSEPVTSPQR